MNPTFARGSVQLRKIQFITVLKKRPKYLLSRGYGEVQPECGLGSPEKLRLIHRDIPVSWKTQYISVVCKLQYFQDARYEFETETPRGRESKSSSLG